MSKKASNPYVGPVPFEINDERGFYGRSGDLRRLAILFIAQRIVLLYSPSGAGKTSLVQARLIPALETEGFKVLPVIRVNQGMANGSEGINPFIHSTILSLEKGQEMDQTPGSFSAYWQSRREVLGDKPAVLFFDQFEEVVTVNPHDHQQKVDFFDQLGAALERDDNLWALLAIREDYLAELDPYRHLIPGKLNSSYRLELLNERQALAAVQKPATDVGVTFSDEAAGKLVGQLRRVTVRRRDGKITFEEGPFVEPVQLQVVCQTLWQDLEPEVGGTIGADSVSAEGHVDESLGEFYDRTVAQIATKNGVDQRDIRDWFDRQLITEQGLRGQVMGSEDLGLSQAVVDDLVTAHLIRAEERRGIQWYELAHDRLVKPVREHNNAWYTQNLSLLQLRAEVWNKKQDDGSLLKGEDLAEAETWAEGKKLKEHEEAFLEKSRELERERKAEEIRRRRLMVTGIAGILLVMGIALGMFFLWQRAEEAQEIAEFNAQIAEEAAVLANLRFARSLTAQGQAEFEEDPLLGLSLILEGLTLVQEKDQDIQKETLADSRERVFQWGRLLKLGNNVNDIWNFPDRSTMIISRDNAPGEVRRTADGELLYELAGEVDWVDFSPDENASVFVIDYFDAPDEVRRTADGEQLYELAGEVDSVTFSPDENASVFVIGYSFGSPPDEVRRTADGELLFEPTAEVDWVDFSPDENASVFMVDYFDAPMEVRRTADGELLFEPTEEVDWVDFSPDETASVFVVYYFNVPAEVRRTADGEPLFESTGEVGWVHFSPDEAASVFVVDYLNVPDEVRRTADGELLYELAGEVVWIDFSLDEAASVFVVDYGDASAEVRRTADGEPLAELAGVVAYDGITFSPDGTASVFVVNYDDAPAEVRRTADGEPLAELAGTVTFDGITFSPDEAASVFVVDYFDAPAEVRRTADGEPLAELAGVVSQVIFSTDEGASVFVVDYDDAPAEVRRTADGELLAELAGEVDWVDFSPDENASVFVVGYSDAPVEVRRTADGELLYELAGKVNRVTFSLDEAASIFVVDYDDVPDEVRRTADGTILTGLSVNLLYALFSPDNESLIVALDDGRAYLLDLDWLQSMDGRADELSIDELVKLACDGPLSRDLAQPNSIRTYLAENIGIDKPQACR